jgi:chromosome segregation ATPase
MEDLQGRLGKALERIAGAADRWDPAALSDARAALEEALAREPEPPAEPEADPAELAELRAALEDERTANAQLEERIRELRARLADKGPGDADLREQLAAQREGMAQIDAELQRMRRTNDMLSRTSEALREANARGVGDPELINQALAAELEALRAARATDAAETRAVMDTLAPLLDMEGQG